ncbi:MAG: hypothetical protein RL432_1838 [Bacteroidota bacterium]|jgi:hypothetical protein
MSKIFIVFFLLIGLNSFAQCVNLTIKEHFSGDPICNLYSGAILEICYEDKTVTAGSCGTLYIKSVSGVANQTFELALDNVYWAPTYATLQINTNTKRLGFVIGGNMGLYSYYNENDIQKQRELEAAERIKREQIRQQEEKRKLDIDQLAYPVINQLVEEKKYLEAESKLKNLFFPNSYEKAAIIYEQARIINLTNERKIIASIETLLNEKNTGAAIQKYNSLNLLKDSVRIQLMIRFTQQFSDSLINGKIENITTFLQNTTNKDLLSKVEDGTSYIIIGQNGEVENANNSKFIINALKNSTIDYFGFTVPIKTKYTFKISTQKEKVNIDSVRYIFSEKFKRKTLYVSKKGDFYFNKFGAPLNAKMLKHPQYIDEEIKKYDVNVEYLYQYKKVANGIVLSSKKRWEQEKVIKAKKGTGRKIVRILLSPIWGPFYLLSLNPTY